MRALVVATALVTAPACATAVQHPVPTIGVVAGAIGFGACELDQVNNGACAIAGGAAALFLGGIAALVYLITDQPTPQMEGEVVDEPPLRRHHAPILLPPEPSPSPSPSPGSASPSSASPPVSP